MAYCASNVIKALCCLILSAGSRICAAESDVIIKKEMDDSMNIQSLLQEYIEDSGAVGASVAIIDNGKISFYSHGKMSVDGIDLISENTVFEIGSVTKVFTALLLADMTAKGEAQLDDAIEMYLPDIQVPERDGKKITLRHLACHTSGMPRAPDGFFSKDLSNPYADISVDDLYTCLSRCSLRAAPGEQFEYSNFGMSLVGHILSVKANKGYEQLISERVSAVLGMKHTGICPTAEMQEVFATGHHLRQPVGNWDFTPSAVGCGGLRSNIKDMVNFLAANMDGSQSPIHALLSQCHQQQHSPTPGFGVGLGWMLSTSNQAELVWHNGGTGGFRSYIGFNPKLKKGVVILSNSTEDWPDEFGLVVLDPDYKRPAIDSSLANDPKYLNQFVGSYTVTIPGDLPKQELTISVYGKLLEIVLPGGEVGVLYPESPGIFGIKGFPDGKVLFSFDEAGCISKVEARLKSNETLLWDAVPVKVESVNEEVRQTVSS